MARWLLFILLGATGCAAASRAPAPTPPPPPVAPDALRAVSAFDDLSGDARAAALFTEMSRVLLHPRCANCHPSDDRPRQGMAQVVHDPPVWRGPDNHGVSGNHCDTCHQSANSPVARVPGAPNWHLAPLEMGWIGRSPAQVCAQVKDSDRNGGLDLEGLYDHLADDPLVAWGWAPGHDRTPAPGSQQALAALTRAWIDAGAHCPEETP